VSREEIFITTKFFPRPTTKDPVKEIEQSLKRLRVDHVDLYIIHWPEGGPTWAWPGMEQSLNLNYSKSIGISNFSAGEINELTAEASVVPAVNQVQFNPFQFRRGLLEHCEQRDITLEAYSPLGTGRHLDNSTVKQVAESIGRTPAQVLLRWCLQRNVPVIPKSTHRERIEQNLQIFDFTLSDEEMKRLDALDQSGETDEARAQSDKWW
jgi:2,5-diketo-D-gluconate reductase A